MTHEELQDIYTSMIARYGDKLPDPVHYPIQFNYFVKLFLYYRDRGLL